MTDDLDPHQLLGSAAFDGELTTEERARAESSREVQDLVVRHAALRDALTDVPAPPPEVRESALAAALGVFDELHAAGPIAEGVAPVVALANRRRSQYRWLGAAAAAVVAIGIAVGVTRGNDSNDDDFSTAAVQTTIVTGDASSKTGAPPEAADGGAAADTDDGEDSSTASPENAADAAESVPRIAEALPVTTAAAAIPAPSPSLPPAFSDVDPWASAPVLNDDDAVRAYALAPGSPLDPSILASTTADTTSAATETTAAGSETTSAATADSDAASQRQADIELYTRALSQCGIAGLPSTPIVYGGQPTLLVRDDDAGELRVIDPTDCATVTRIPLD